MSISLDMEMPRDCKTCPFRISSWCIVPGNWRERYYIPESGRSDYCPLSEMPTNPWHRVEDGLPKESGEYIVAYHPCYWDDVDTEVTKVGIDNFRGRSAWAKKKFQRVTHWMEKPEPPQEEEK